MRDIINLLRRWRREDVSQRGAMRHSGADKTAEGRIVTLVTPDQHYNLAGLGLMPANDAAIHPV